MKRYDPRRGAKAAEFASGLTLAWFWMGVFPALVMGTLALPALTLSYFIGGGVAVVATWWWVVRVVQAQRAAGKRLQDLQRLSPEAFAGWAGERFRERGYTVERHAAPGAAPDGGVHLLVARGEERALVQCKQHTSWSVGQPAVRALFEAMRRADTGRAYLLTTGRFTAAARDWASARPLTLWDVDTLLAPALPETDPPSGPPSGTSPAETPPFARLPRAATASAPSPQQA